MSGDTCDVCKKNVSIGVACVPGCPVSAAYCKECLEANAHPLDILIANTACCDGLEHTNLEWREMVEATCKHLGKTMDEFTKEVNISISELANYKLDETRIM